MAKAISTNSKNVLDFLKTKADATGMTNLTASDIAVGMGMATADDVEGLKAATKKINGILTAGLARKDKVFIERVTGEFFDEEAQLHKAVKVIKVTEAGMAYDHSAAVAEDVQAQLAAQAE